MRSRCIIVFLAVALLSGGVAGSADARPLKKSYWTERKAERRVLHRFSDVRSVDCIGFGYNWRIRRGTEYYTAFYCDGELTDFGTFAITIYTTGKYSFRWYPY